ncbi:DMT family transporter [Clostridium fungisolvens]|uniref:Transporter family-2 protein n=1 Tax=Clostridium fungisolvens TaxID=1604897 RepID=A0A6V8SP14_9CLOT|nr:DMT family transporter [Clostridium fungisolvens]GFP78436.1 hypothetical protein bsdtw1_04661 [Clostridium fungisolvens]
MYKLFTVIIGFIITIMISFNSELQASVGNNLSLVVIHLVGLISVIIVMVVKKEKFSMDLHKVPLYLLSAGLIGVMVVLINNLTFSKVGASLSISLGMVGQLTAATVIDHFGLLGMKKYSFEKKKLLGFAFIILGIVVMALY